MNVPAGVSIVSGSVTQTFGTLAADDSASAVWQVQGDTDGIKTFTASAQGTAYGETFTDAGSDDLTVDNTAPTVSVNGPGVWSASASPEFTWSAEDASGVASYDVFTSIGGAAPTLVADDTTDTSGSFTAPEGINLGVIVTAKDNAGNQSAAVGANTTIDAIPPTISITPPSISRGTATAFVQAQNVGSPIIVSGVASPSPGTEELIPSMVLSYINGSVKAVSVTFRASANDAFGRKAAATVVTRVPSRWIPAAIKLSKSRSKAGITTLRGSIAKAATGIVKITATRVGKSRTKRRSKDAIIESGKFSTRLRLAPGRYRVKVLYLGNRTVRKSSTRRIVRAK